MPKKEDWKYVDGKLKEKVTTYTNDKTGEKRIVHQKARETLGGLGPRSVTKITKEVKIKPGKKS